MLSGHSGKEFILSLIRQKYWIIGARQIIRQIKRQCITCRKCFEPPCVQLMADLPFDRVTPDMPPSNFVGVDFFGPILVKIGRSEVKRYGCLFTCLTVRTVHRGGSFARCGLFHQRIAPVHVSTWTGVGDQI